MTLGLNNNNLLRLTRCHDYIPIFYILLKLYFPELFAEMAMYIDTITKNTVMNLITEPPSLKSTSEADSHKLSLRQVNT